VLAVWGKSRSAAQGVTATEGSFSDVGVGLDFERGSTTKVIHTTGFAITASQRKRSRIVAFALLLQVSWVAK
jgi:hypothetical protein